MDGGTSSIWGSIFQIFFLASCLCLKRQKKSWALASLVLGGYGAFYLFFLLYSGYCDFSIIAWSISAPVTRWRVLTARITFAKRASIALQRFCQ